MIRNSVSTKRTSVSPNGTLISPKRTFVFGALLLALMLVISACSGAPAPAPTTAPAPTEPPAATQAPATTQPAAGADEWGTVTVKKGDTIKVGLSAALTGDLAIYGLDIQKGAQIAADAFGKDVVPGFSVEVVSEDDQCSGPGGTAVANKFAANPQIVGTVSFMCSSSEIPGTEILDKAHIVSITPSATGATVVSRGLQTVFRTANSDVVQGRVDGDFLTKELKLSDIAILHDGSVYGEGLAQVVKDTIEKNGGKVTDFEAITVGEKDFRSTLTKITAGNPKAIFFGGFWPEAAILVAQKNEVGLTDATFMSADGTYSPKFVETAGDAGKGAYTSFGSALKGATYADFVKAYESNGGKADQIVFSPQSYDAMHVITEALKSAGKVDADGNLVIGRKAFADAVRAVKLDGATGPLAFDETGDRPASATNVVVYQDKDGTKWEQVFPAPSSGASSGTLPDLGGRAVQVGSDTTYPPFESVDANGKIVGFDIEIVDAICAKINCKATFTTTDFQGIFAALAQGRFDMVASGVTITDERKKTVDFSLPMMKNTQVLLVRADETRVNSTADLKNPEIKVAVQNGTTNEITARKLVADPDKQVVLFDDFNLAVASVLNKQADVVVIDTFAGAALLEQNKGKVKTVGEQFGDETLGYVFKKGDTAFIDAFNAGLKAVVKDGTYKTLCEKWWKDITPAPDCTASGLEISQ